MSNSSSQPEGSNSNNGRDFGAATLIRIFTLHQRLCRGATVTAIDLAAELGVNERTIRRDIEVMRDQLGAPLERDPAEHTYYYSRTCDLLPFVRLAPEQAFALAVAAHAFAGGGGAPLGGDLATALEKLTPLIGGIVSFPLKELATVVSAPPASPAEFRHIGLLVQAALHRRTLRLVYQKPGATTETRTVHPLHLAALEHRWMLIAHDPAAGKAKSFLLARIRDLAANGRTFERPGNFDAAQYLQGSLGRFAGDAEIEVRIAFAPKVAGYARENFRHASRQFAALPDGRTQLTLRLNNLVDIKNTVLAYGEHAEVLAPRALREQVRAALATALAQYA